MRRVYQGRIKRVSVAFFLHADTLGASVPPYIPSLPPTPSHPSHVTHFSLFTNTLNQHIFTSLYNTNILILTFHLHTPSFTLSLLFQLHSYPPWRRCAACYPTFLTTKKAEATVERLHDHRRL